MIFEILSTLLITPLIIRSLGQAEYGVYKLAASAASYLTLLDLGLGNSVIRYTAKYKEEGNLEKQRQFFGVAQTYYSIIAIVAFLLSVLLVLMFPKLFAVGLTNQEILLGQKLLFGVSLNMVITLATAAFTNIIIGYGYFTVSKGASIVQIIIRIIVTYVALKLGFKSLGIVNINLFTTIICKVFYIFFVFSKLKLFPKISGVKKSFVTNIVGPVAIFYSIFAVNG